MKVLTVAFPILLALSACSWNEQDRCEFGNGSLAFIGMPLKECRTNQKYKEAYKQFWIKYVNKMKGKCLHRWDGQESVISTDTVNNDPSWVAICHITHYCDYRNLNKCVDFKSCNEFSSGYKVYENIKNGFFTETRCVSYTFGDE